MYEAAHNDPYTSQGEDGRWWAGCWVCGWESDVDYASEDKAVWAAEAHSEGARQP